MNRQGGREGSDAQEGSGGGHGGRVRRGCGAGGRENRM